MWEDKSTRAASFGGFQTVVMDDGRINVVWGGDGDYHVARLSERLGRRHTILSVPGPCSFSLGEVCPSKGKQSRTLQRVYLEEVKTTRKMLKSKELTLDDGRRREMERAVGQCARVLCFDVVW